MALTTRLPRATAPANCEQIRRLDSVIRRLEADCREADLEVSDLGTRLTALCFIDQGLKGPAEHDEALLVPILTYDEGGFIWQESASTLADGSPSSTIKTDDVQSLIAELPAWELMEEMLLDFGQDWVVCNEWHMSPRVPRDIEKMYKNVFSPAPSAQMLADIFALIALRHSLHGTSNMRRPRVSQIHQESAIKYYDLAQHALLLGNFREAATLYGVRAMHALIYLDVHAWVDPSRIKKGLNQLPLLMSAIYSLGWNEDGCFEGESPVDRYERQAIVSASIKAYFWYSMSYGIKTLFRHSTVKCSSPPQMLSEEDLPFDDKYEDYRAPNKCLQMLKVQQHLALMANELQEDILNAAQCSKKQLADLNRRLRTLKEHGYDGDWRLTEDKQSGQRYFALRANLLPPKERYLRCYSLVWSIGILVKLHEAFIFAAPSEAAIHRQAIAEALSDGIASMSECHKLIGAFPSVSYACYNTLIAAGLLLGENGSSLPLTAFERTTCDRFLRFYLDITSVVGLPKPMLVLIKIVSFLLSPTSEDRRYKRSRTECLKRIRKGIVAPVQAPEVRDDSFSFDYGFNLPPDEDEGLRRKTRTPSSGSWSTSSTGAL